MGEIKENFSIEDKKAKEVIRCLETIGFLGKNDESGLYKVIMDRQEFLRRLNGYKSLADRIKATASSQNPDLADITISRTLIEKESDHAVKTRVPGTWGRQSRYIWINKEDIMDIHNGKTMLTFINTNKKYKLYDADNRVVETISGKSLYENHYDRIKSSVRAYYSDRKKDRDVSESEILHNNPIINTVMNYDEKKDKSKKVPTGGRRR